MWTDGRGGDSDIYFAKANLTPPDTTQPFIEIASPSDGENLTSTDVIVTGTAVDNVAVERVEIRSDRLDWARANGTSSWSGNLSLSVGDNTIYARATDTAGNSNTTSVRVNVAIPATSLPSWPLIVASSVAVAGVVAFLLLRRRHP